MKNKIYNILVNGIGYAMGIPVTLLAVVGAICVAPAIMMMELNGAEVELSVTEKQRSISNDKIEEES